MLRMPLRQSRRRAPGNSVASDHYGLAGSGNRAMTPEQLLTAAGIHLESATPGNYSTTCPQCSATRQQHNQKKECLSVKIDGAGATWCCHHCGWSGPEKGGHKSNGQGGEFA